MVRSTRRAPAVRMRVDGTTTARPDTVAGEEPLEIKLEGEPWLITMRTPGDDVDLVHGLLLAEGVITEATDVARVSFGGIGADGHTDYNAVEVALDPALGKSAELASLRGRERAVYVSASCGVCGTSASDALARTSAFPILEPGAVGRETTVALTTLLSLPDALRAKQKLFERTGGVHAAGLFTTAGELLCLREDVGRHNAVDKVLGWALRQGHIPAHDSVLQVSGRLSFELVQKCAMAGVPILSAVSAATAAAIDLAEESHITLAAFSRGTSIQVYTHPERIVT